MAQYKHRNNDNYPDASVGLFTEIEATIEFLIQLGDQYNLNMEMILNHKANNGITLFWWAAYHSEKVAKMLLQRNVKVNTIDQKFDIPTFRVSK